ncbi:unnamed protein product [Chrysodeixis includens]|uniref:Uncharacterized protein n=1 Tax=Chrysodeixis includens TaxID=689277 RepID=A0A9P0FTS2_CHRIL|nr:unnamed protein product [Chrysodeixis includens]
MAYTWTILVALLCVNSVLSKRCDLKDSDCLTRWANMLYPAFIKGSTTIKSSDPIHNDIVEAELPTFKYSLRNAELTGMKDCRVAELEYNENSMTYKYFVQCPHIKITADHEAKGDLLGFMVDIKGKLTINGDDYKYNFSGKVETTTGADGKKYIQLITHEVEAGANGKLELDFKNDYDASSSDFTIIQKFLNENWKDMDDKLRKPTVDGFMNIFLDNLNAYFKGYPFEPFVPDD